MTTNMKKIIELTDHNFAAEISSADVPVLVDFYAPWCGPCRMLGPVLERLAEELDGKVKVAKVNVDESPNLANRFQITGVPALILFNRGQPVDGMVGFAPPNQLKAWLEQAAGVAV